MEKVSELQCPWHVCIRGLCPAWYSGVIWSLPGSLVASVMEMFTTEHSAGGSCLVLAMRTWTRHDRLHWQHSPFSGMLGKHLISSTTVPSVHLVAMAATRIAVIILTAAIITYHAFLIHCTYYVFLIVNHYDSLWFIMSLCFDMFWWWSPNFSLFLFLAITAGDHQTLCALWVRGLELGNSEDTALDASHWTLFFERQTSTVLLSQSRRCATSLQWIQQFCNQRVEILIDESWCCQICQSKYSPQILFLFWIFLDWVCVFVSVQPCSHVACHV